ncbi:MAG: tRNA (adenosine(37)-N6)-threonylcarbamoyltransferase complex dimerization subunit type 1 TsaB [Deltaproteobacteria bacterium]|nr:tRNA (adenosine(37)-N6)-threonylcarbamoyltransferase complex dimerization subunit type 1 TsaB [Deltaproteobacteria bacterium]
MILAINTSTTQFSIALLRITGDVTAEYLIAPGEKNFRTFMPAVYSVFDACGRDIRDLKTVAVVTGPGSFTGLRVGLSMAKGVTQGLGIPIIGVSSLEAMANQMPFTKLPVCTLMSSRRGEIIFAVFKWDDAKGMTRLTEDRSVVFGDLAGFIKGPAFFLGNNFTAQEPEIRKLLKGNAITAPSHLWNIRASTVGVLGLKRFTANDFDSITDLVPEYLRPPDIRADPFALNPSL